MKYLSMLIVVFLMANCTDSSVEKNRIESKTSTERGKKSAPIQISFEVVNEFQINANVLFASDASGLKFEVHDYRKLQSHVNADLPEQIAKNGAVVIPIRLDANHSIDRIAVMVSGSFGGGKLSKGAVYSFENNQKKEKSSTDHIIEEDGRKVHILK